MFSCLNSWFNFFFYLIIFISILSLNIWSLNSHLCVLWSHLWIKLNNRCRITSYFLLFILNLLVLNRRFYKFCLNDIFLICLQINNYICRSFSMPLLRWLSLNLIFFLISFLYQILLRSLCWRKWSHIIFTFFCCCWNYGLLMWYWFLQFLLNILLRIRSYVAIGLCVCLRIDS